MKLLNRLDSRSCSRFDKYLVTAFLLNAIDIILTVALISNQEIVEANPIMAWCLSKHPALFAFAKISLLGSVCFVLRTRMDARKDSNGLHYALGIITGLFIFICAWQTSMVFWYLNR